MKTKLYQICDKMLHNSWTNQAEYEAAVNYLARVEKRLNALDPELAWCVNELIRRYNEEMEAADRKAHEETEVAQGEKYMDEHPEEFEFYNDFLSDDEMKGLYF